MWISSTANSIASRSRPRLIAFCIAETQAIAGRPFLVSGIICAAPSLRDGDERWSRPRLGGDDGAGLLERIGVNGEKRLGRSG